MGRCELFEETDERQGGGEDLLRALDKLVKELKLVGYVPDSSLVFHADMEDEDKEITLRYHSEKLAIAFGLLNSPPWYKNSGGEESIWGLTLYSKLYKS
ncbi:pentatricopeptide repeat-containing protein [Quercus suber]|uniref:Pentatricopeptide repeat-containing protein n=1 Tax=Quercus suber TaxID=58331 RepID=A0AAW0IZH0_QUESU